METSIFTQQEMDQLKIEQGNAGFCYGKADKYYTLYKYDIHSDGISGCITFTFVKIMGKIINDKYPCSDKLHGKLVSEHYDSNATGESCRFIEKVDYTLLKFGKYCGKHLNEIEDINYLLWLANYGFMNNNNSEAYKIECNKEILSRGQNYVRFDGEDGFMMVDSTDKIWCKIINGESFDIFSEKNVSNDNGLLYYPGFSIPFQFEFAKNGRFASSVAKNNNDDKYFNIKNKNIKILKYQLVFNMPMFSYGHQTGIKNVLLIEEWDFIK